MFQGGSRPHVIFAKSEVRVAVFDDGNRGKELPTGFSADVEGKHFYAFCDKFVYFHIRVVGWVPRTQVWHCNDTFRILFHSDRLIWRPTIVQPELEDQHSVQQCEKNEGIKLPPKRFQKPKGQFPLPIHHTHIRCIFKAREQEMTLHEARVDRGPNLVHR